MRIIPPPAIALGLKPQATVPSESANTVAKSASFTPSTPASKGNRSGLFYLNGEQVEQDATQFLEVIERNYEPVLSHLDRTGLKLLKTLVRTCGGSNDVERLHSFNTGKEHRLSFTSFQPKLRSGEPDQVILTNSHNNQLDGTDIDVSDQILVSSFNPKLNSILESIAAGPTGAYLRFLDMLGVWRNEA
jgi:hypothetical protein